MEGSSSEMKMNYECLSSGCSHTEEGEKMDGKMDSWIDGWVDDDDERTVGWMEGLIDGR